MMLALLVLPLGVLVARAVSGLAAADALSVLDGSALGSAISLSIASTLSSVLIIVLLGTPLAFVFARYHFPLKRFFNVLIELPVVLPPVVAGLALLMTFGRRGILGQSLAALGLSVPFSVGAVVIAQVFVASPFYIRAAQNGGFHA